MSTFIQGNGKHGVLTSITCTGFPFRGVTSTPRWIVDRSLLTVDAIQGSRRISALFCILGVTMTNRKATRREARSIATKDDGAFSDGSQEAVVMDTRSVAMKLQLNGTSIYWDGEKECME